MSKRKNTGPNILHVLLSTSLRINIFANTEESLIQPQEEFIRPSLQPLEEIQIKYWDAPCEGEARWCSWKLEERGNALFLLWIAFFIFQIFDPQEITDMQLFSAFERDSWCGQPHSREANVHCTLQRKPKSSSCVLSSRSLAEPQNWLPASFLNPLQLILLYSLATRVCIHGQAVTTSQLHCRDSPCSSLIFLQPHKELWDSQGQIQVLLDLRLRQFRIPCCKEVKFKISDES